MPKTAVGLFESPEVADEVVRDLGTIAFPQNEIRILREPREMPVTGIMSLPHTDFEVGLERELESIGATLAEANAYARGVRRGGVLVFATGSDKQVDDARGIMNRHGAAEAEELTGREPNLDTMANTDMAPVPDGSSQVGRLRESGSGARLFVW
jgi:hypothetical protein